VQWATGNIGTRALREIIRHPDLELVGVFVYDSQKVGLDAGELCREPATGIATTTDRAAIQALRADCVVYMARAFALDDVVPAARAGHERRDDVRRPRGRRTRARAGRARTHRRCV
jgi:4-hydroxy-tetrahydrodipicolinate reductase